MIRLNRSVLYEKYPFEEPLLESKNYFDEYREILKPYSSLVDGNISENKRLENEFYSNFLGLSFEQIQELNEATSVSKLDCEDELEPITYDLDEGETAFTFKYGMVKVHSKGNDALKSVEMRNKLKDISSKFNLKYEQHKWLCHERHPSVKCDLNPFDFSTVLFIVHIYRPYLSDEFLGSRIRLLHEIHIRGDQFLSELKDEIHCAMDYVGICDVSDSICSKIDKITLKKREEYLSSFIFIENTFYNDTRSTSLRDLSKTIIDWAKSGRVGSFLTGSMEKTRMLDLNLRIGRPYVYQHQADCEHIIVISDIRFLNSCDPLKKIIYPRLYARANVKGRRCVTCGEAFARWLVKGSRRLMYDKNYMCGKCFKSYNFINGQKIEEIQAFEYVDPVALS